MTLKKKFKIVSINLFVLLILLLILDNILFFFPEIFPKDIVRLLTKGPQIKYQLKYPETINLKHDQYIYYYSPNKYIKELSITIDEFGYKNPPGYLESSKIDVLLIGDSFTEANEFSKTLRKLIPHDVYSMGIGGQTVFHWKYHIKRYKKSKYYKNPPKFVVLNFYGGNDITDNKRAVKYYKAGFQNSIYYPKNPIFDNFSDVNRRISFYDELASVIKKIYLSFKLKITNKIYQNKNLITSRNIIKYNDECTIRIEPTEISKENFFSESTQPDMVEDIINTIKLFDKEKTIFIFSYIPNTLTIYRELLTNDMPKYNFMHKVNNESRKNLKNFLKKINVHYVDFTEPLEEKAKTTPLHPCSGDDAHFNAIGYETYSEMLANEIMKIQ